MIFATLCSIPKLEDVDQEMTILQNNNIMVVMLVISLTAWSSELGPLFPRLAKRVDWETSS